MPTLAALSTGLARSLLALPRRRSKVRHESSWIPMEDGVRLATRHLSPLDGEQRAPTVLIRTPYGTRGARGYEMFLGQLIAEAGYHVVVQDVRGRWDSEGSFTPFANEARDGGRTVEWISEQAWYREGIGLVGWSYSGHAAWAALSAAPEQVRALVVVTGTRDLYPAFYSGGAFSLATALDWATHVGDRETTPRGWIDLERGLRHQPVYEADRVALRRIDWFRDWVDHPRRDAYWQDLLAELPDRPPPTLLIAGWYDIFLAAQLRDYAKLVDRAWAGSAPRLVVGPWAHGRAAHPRWRALKRGFFGVCLNETLAFLDHHLASASEGDESARPFDPSTEQPVRFFAAGAEEWRSAPTWPPPEARDRFLYLRGGESGPASREGALSWDPPTGHEEPDCFEADPANPVPCVGGAFFSSRLWGRGNGAVDQRCLDGRTDLYRYTGEILARDLEIAGSIQLLLHASTDAQDADFTAKLVDVSPDGSAVNVCEGIVRARWCGGDEAATQPRWLVPGEPRALEIELWASAWRFRRGHRIRLEVASASFPRFDRNPAGREALERGGRGATAASRHTLLHDRDHLSHLVLPVISGSDTKGPPG